LASSPEDGDAGARRVRSGESHWGYLFCFPFALRAVCSRRVSEVTRILDAIQKGEPKASEELLPLVYDELRRLAAWHMARESPGQTLQSTALVHEAWLRLIGQDAAQWNSQRHFISAAAEAMRRILIENARRKQRLKRGGNLERVDANEVEIPMPMPDDDLLAMNDALERQVGVDPRAAEVVKLYFNVGLTQAQAAEHLGVSVATAERLWAFARAIAHGRGDRP
jgi:RNA polymerase sigma factor (TIGR02999 family)